MQMIPRFVAGAMGVLLALPFALQWLSMPEACSGSSEGSRATWRRSRS